MATTVSFSSVDVRQGIVKGWPCIVVARPDLELFDRSRSWSVAKGVLLQVHSSMVGSIRNCDGSVGAAMLLMEHEGMPEDCELWQKFQSLFRSLILLASPWFESGEFSRRSDTAPIAVRSIYHEIISTCSRLYSFEGNRRSRNVSAMQFFVRRDQKPCVFHAVDSSK